MSDNVLTTIGVDHPLYDRIVELLGVDLNKLAEEASTQLSKIELPPVDFDAMALDYNALGTNEILAFLLMAGRTVASINQALIRRGLMRSRDFKVFAFEVLAIESNYLIANAPTTEILQGEFSDYACLSGEVYPDPEKHPNITAMDQAIPKRSNKNLTSDTLPVLANIWQVYILKTSSAQMNEIGPVGRRRKA